MPVLDYKTKLAQSVKLFYELEDLESIYGRGIGILFYMVFRKVLGPKQLIFNS
jgi:hypothetical protein